jgi:polar amino acid transport system substrate-binding protein
MHNPTRWAPSRHLLATVSVIGVSVTLVVGINSSKSSAASSRTVSAASVAKAKSGSVKVDSKLAAEVPASVKSAGITAAIDPSFPVDNYYASNGTTVVGLSPDLLKDVGQVLGVKIKITPLSLTSIIPGLQDKRFAMAGMVLTDTGPREKQFTLIDFQHAGQEFLVKSGNPDKISSLADTCGKPIAVEQGGTPVALLQTQSSKCTKAGKAAVTISQFPTANQALLAVESGRADATISDYTKTGYQVQHSNHELQEAGSPFGDTPAGWGIPKGSALVKPLVGAIDELISNGTYAKVFKKYGLTKAELSKAEVNAASAGAS